MPSADEMRAYVERMYPGPRWKKRVSRMPDGQVMAIYMREHDPERKPKKQPPKESDDDATPF